MLRRIKQILIRLSPTISTWSFPYIWHWQLWDGKAGILCFLSLSKNIDQKRNTFKTNGFLCKFTFMEIWIYILYTIPNTTGITYITIYYHCSSARVICMLCVSQECNLFFFLMLFTPTAIFICLVVYPWPQKSKQVRVRLTRGKCKFC